MNVNLLVRAVLNTMGGVSHVMLDIGERHVKTRVRLIAQDTVTN